MAWGKKEEQESIIKNSGNQYQFHQDACSTVIIANDGFMNFTVYIQDWGNQHQQNVEKRKPTGYIAKKKAIYKN